MGPGGFILLTAPSLLCIENTVFPFRWRDDGREKGSWVVVDERWEGGGTKDSPHNRLQTSKSCCSSLHKKESEGQTVRREGTRDQEKYKGRQGRRREGRKKNNNGTKECVIKTGNGRREEGSGGFQKEAGRGRFSREWRSGADTRAV